MNQQMTPLIPLEQAIVTLAGHEFLVVRLPGGVIAVVFRHLCDALNLSRVGQVERIQRNPMLSQHFPLVLIKTPGGPQVVHALSVSVLSLWLGGFHINRLSEKKRALIMQLQQDAEAAFTGHFRGPDPQTQPQSAPPKPQPPQPPLPSPDLSSMSVFDLLRAAINRIEQEHQEMQAWRNRMEQEYREMQAWQNSMERQHDQEVEWMTDAKHQMLLQREEMEIFWSIALGKVSATEDALSADHHQTLEFLLRYHQRVTGQPRAAILRELLMAVGAADLGHLQEKDWKQIVAWFRQRLGW